MRALWAWGVKACRRPRPPALAYPRITRIGTAASAVHDPPKGQSMRPPVFVAHDRSVNLEMVTGLSVMQNAQPVHKAAA